MATQQGRTIPAIEGRLAKEARKFEFFQAIRRLQRGAERSGGAHARVSVGENGPLEHEPVRFGAEQTFSFSGSEISRFEPSDDDKPSRMHVNFMGLTGASGVLPLHYTAWVMHESRQDNEALSDFFDLFNHRLISLFYRAWEKYRRHVLLESNSDVLDPHDDFSNVVASLTGFGSPGTRNRMAIPDSVIMFLSGHFTQRPANAASLELMVSEYIGASTKVVQFEGCWLELEPEIQTQLSSSDPNPGPAACLGHGAVAGDRVWDIQSRFRLRIGPLRWDEFAQLLPGESRLLSLSQLIRSYVGSELDFDMQLILHAEDVPWCKLDGSARLGLNTWVRNEPCKSHADDAVFGVLGV